MAQALGGQAFEWGAWQPDVLQNRGLASKVQHALNAQHRLASAHGQVSRDIGRRPQAFAVHNLALRLALAAGVALVWHELKEAVLHLMLSMGGYKGAPALAPNQQVVGGKFIDGFANRALADPKSRRKLDFAGDQFAGFPFAQTQAVE